MTQCRLLTPAEFSDAEKARYALAQERGKDPAWMAANSATYGWARIDEVTGPCVMWFATWMHDPQNPEHAPRREKALEALARGDAYFAGHHYYLSKHYWRDWSDKRPPIVVLCPNGAEWCVDAKASNGDGWVVTGEAPNITCQPSIQVPGYHGYLQGGAFTVPL
jgi:hypothetical protein